MKRSGKGARTLHKTLAFLTDNVFPLLFRSARRDEEADRDDAASNASRLAILEAQVLLRILHCSRAHRRSRAETHPRHRSNGYHIFFIPFYLSFFFFLYFFSFKKGKRKKIDRYTIFPSISLFATHLTHCVHSLFDFVVFLFSCSDEIKCCAPIWSRSIIVSLI